LGQVVYHVYLHNLISVKTRVAHFKKLTMPKLKLCEAVQMARLQTLVAADLDVDATRLAICLERLYYNPEMV